MPLTTFQRRALEVYRWYHLHPPAWQFYVSAMLRRSAYQIYLAIAAIALLLLLTSRITTIGAWIYLFLGVIIGLILRGLLAYHQTIRLWPVLTSIIDWDKVDTLLDVQPPEQPEMSAPS